MLIFTLLLYVQSDSGHFCFCCFYVFIFMYDHIEVACLYCMLTCVRALSSQVLVEANKYFHCQRVMLERVRYKNHAHTRHINMEITLQHLYTFLHSSLIS